MKSCIAEGLGIFVLTFFGVGSIVLSATGEGNLLTIALAHGLALAMMVYATAHISGAHINPAVTISMLVNKRIKPPEAAGYMVSQLLGAIVAGVLYDNVFIGKNK